MDPRIARTRDAVRRATLTVLAERGYAAFTVEAVAEAARVAKSTIYRHWPTKLGLVADALEALNEQPRPAPGEGTVRDQVEVLVVHLAEGFASSPVGACMPALVEAAEHQPEVATFLHGYAAGRRGTLVDLLRRGVEAGELPAHLDPELASLALVGPIVYCRALTPDRFPAARAAALVAQVLGPG